MSLTYLASPYSKYPYGRKAAYYEACFKAARLMEKGENIFCPIAHSHSIEEEAMPAHKDGDWWLKQDFAVLQHCSKLIVYRMEGWEDSYGVQKEIEYAKQLGIPVEYVD